MKRLKHAPLAQLVEHLTLNQGVPGSSPWWCTRKITRGLFNRWASCNRTWLVGQAVKTPASHAGNAGSIPARVTIWLNRTKVCLIYWPNGHKLIVGVDDAEGSPVPIPNTEVKLCSAEDSALAMGCENRKTPTLTFLHSSVGSADVHSNLTLTGRQKRISRRNPSKLPIFLHSSVGSVDVHSNLTLTGRQKRKSSEKSEKTYMILHSSVGRASV